MDYITLHLDYWENAKRTDISVTKYVRGTFIVTPNAVVSIILGGAFVLACTPRRAPSHEIEGKEALPATSESTNDSTPTSSASEPDPKKEEPASADGTPVQPADITLARLIDDSKVPTECPAYQTNIPGRNSFTVQLGEIGDIIAKCSAASRISCTVRGQVTAPPGYWVDLNVDSLKVLGSAVLASVDSVDYSIKVETVSALQYVYRYEKLIIGPRNGPFEATLDTMTPTISDPPCSKEAMAVPFNILIETTLRVATNSSLQEVEGFLTRAPNFAFRFGPCKA